MSIFNVTGIYKITNPNNKVYIGSSINIQKRLTYYKYLNCKGQRKLYNSLLKYGYDNHIIELLEECSIDTLYERERFYGELFNVLSENGLNLILPNNGEIKIGVSEETKQKMSISHTGIIGTPCSEQHKEKIREVQKGRKHTLEHRRKVSQNNARVNSKLVIDLETGIFYDSIKEAAFAKGIVHSTLKNRINGNSPTYTSIAYA